MPKRVFIDTASQTPLCVNGGADDGNVTQTLFVYQVTQFLDSIEDLLEFINLLPPEYHEIQGDNSGSEDNESISTEEKIKINMVLTTYSTEIIAENIAIPFQWKYHSLLTKCNGNIDGVLKRRNDHFILDHNIAKVLYRMIKFAEKAKEVVAEVEKINSQILTPRFKKIAIASDHFIKYIKETFGEYYHYIQDELVHYQEYTKDGADWINPNDTDPMFTSDSENEADDQPGNAGGD